MTLVSERIYDDLHATSTIMINHSFCEIAEMLLTKCVGCTNEVGCIALQRHWHAC